VLRYLHRNFDLRGVQMVGASAGGLICALAACGVDEDKAVSAGCWRVLIVLLAAAEVLQWSHGDAAAVCALRLHPQ